jgi:hypothetical protein
MASDVEFEVYHLGFRKIGYGIKVRGAGFGVRVQG